MQIEVDGPPDQVSPLRRNTYLSRGRTKKGVSESLVALVQRLTERLLNWGPRGVVYNRDSNQQALQSCQLSPLAILAKMHRCFRSESY